MIGGATASQNKTFTKRHKNGNLSPPKRRNKDKEQKIMKKRLPVVPARIYLDGTPNKTTTKPLQRPNGRWDSTVILMSGLLRAKQPQVLPGQSPDTTPLCPLI